MVNSKQVLTSFQLERGHVSFTFSCFWYQEDITWLSKQVFSLLPQVNIVETISGADRENIRLSWQGIYHFCLNFDYYSQSCWLEGEDEVSSEKLEILILACKAH